MDKNNLNRKKIVYKNAIIMLSAQIIQILLGFAVRKYFIAFLGEYYLGYHSVFQNILQALNLADMGIGVAVTSFLYKPLAEHNWNEIKTIMKLYKKLYFIIGIIVLFLGGIVSIFFKIIFPDAQCSILELRILFYISLLGTVSTYYLAYKRTLIVADQKSYITATIDSVSYSVVSILQIITLIIFRSYWLFALLLVVKNVASNFLIAKKCDRTYRELKNVSVCDNQEDIKSNILSYAKDVFVSRIGAYVYYSTDNLIISIFRGSLLAGFFSNYTLITIQVSNIVNQVLLSVQSTYGNYIAISSNKEEQKRITDDYLYVNYCIGNFCMLCILFLIQPFVKLFFGDKYVLNISMVFLLAINLLLTILIQIPSQVFVIYRLYKYDKPIILLSASVNIIVSIALVRKLGVDGVLIGTLVTSLFYLISRLYIISKYVFACDFREYIYKLLAFAVESILSIFVVYLASFSIPGYSPIHFFIRILTVVIISLLFTLAMIICTNHYEFVKNVIVPKKISSLFSKRIILASFVVLFVILVIFNIFCFKNEIFTKDDYRPMEGNKSLKRQEFYDREEVVVIDAPVAELSLDDVLEMFEDITENESKYDSIFENDTLRWLKYLHETYGIKVSCFVFYKDEKWDLSMCTTKYCQEFIDNSDWLRFGFHSYDGGTIYSEKCNRSILEDYNRTLESLKLIVGERSINHFIRLAGFQATENQVKSLGQLGNDSIIGLYTSDDRRNNYYFNDDENKYIYCHDVMIDSKNEMVYISSDLRSEFISDIGEKIEELDSTSWNNQLGYFVLFTHEWECGEPLVRDNTERLLEWANKKGYNSMFFEELYSNQFTKGSYNE